VTTTNGAAEGDRKASPILQRGPTQAYVAKARCVLQGEILQGSNPQLYVFVEQQHSPPRGLRTERRSRQKTNTA
jgi:hypothetical protein